MYSLRGEPHVSYLDIPRICFGGTWTGNVATANNQPFLFWNDANGNTQQAQILDFANAAVLPVTINGKQLTDVELRQMMNDEDIVPPHGNTPPDQGQNWCYWGTNTASFATTVSSVNLGQGNVATDPLVGKPAAFGFTEMCDCNPAGSQSTQMFFGGFNLGGVQLDAQRAFSRWVWFFRNTAMGGSAGASGVFETVLSIDADQWTQLLALDSPAVTALYQAWKAAGPKATGLSLRYGLFATTSERSGQTVNRIGLVSGAIGLATTDELVTFPNCRTLYNNSPAPASLGPVLLKVDTIANIVSVDLFSALPETGTTRATVTKQDMGTLQLTLTGSTGTVLVGTITPAQYGMANVNQQGAIVDVSFAANANAVGKALAGGANFAITSDTKGLLFSEGYWIATDQRDYYLDNGLSGSIQIKASYNGLPIANSTVYLQQFVINYTDDSADTGGAAPSAPAAWVCSMPDQVLTDANGMATIPLTAQATGNTVIRFTMSPDTNAVNVLTDGFANIRVLPTNDYSNVPNTFLATREGFDFVFQEVLRYFYITFPVMQPIMDFSNYEVMTSQQLLMMLQSVTSPTRWWNYGYMPRSRDLSASRQELLQRWSQATYAALYGNN